MSYIYAINPISQKTSKKLRRPSDFTISSIIKVVQKNHYLENVYEMIDFTQIKIEIIQFNKSIRFFETKLKNGNTIFGIKYHFCSK